jgi:hypothetical protein
LLVDKKSDLYTFGHVINKEQNVSYKVTRSKEILYEN